jgi:selenocysteine lyase/cysteine desulfurase
MFALGASVDLIANLGMKNVEERALELNRFLTSRLIDSGWTVLSPIADERMRSAETLVEVDDPAAVVAKLAERKIIVTKKPQGIRVATHFFNNEEDVERLITALSRNV